MACICWTLAQVCVLLHVSSLHYMCSSRVHYACCLQNGDGRNVRPRGNDAAAAAAAEMPPSTSGGMDVDKEGTVHEALGSLRV